MLTKKTNIFFAMVPLIIALNDGFYICWIFRIGGFTFILYPCSLPCWVQRFWSFKIIKRHHYFTFLTTCLPNPGIILLEALWLSFLPWYLKSSVQYQKDLDPLDKMRRILNPSRVLRQGPQAPKIHIIGKVSRLLLCLCIVSSLCS